MIPRPLTCTALLADFPDCVSVAGWQQALAIEAYQRWQATAPLADPVVCYNWGAASFRAPGIAPAYCSFRDPDPQLGGLLGAVFALSVLDRIEQPLRFLRRRADQLLTGGLVVCTFALWDAEGEDCAIGHELRRRIYDRESWRKLLHEIRLLDLHPFGGVDFRYRGDTLGDHTLATLVAVKGIRERG